MLSGRLSPLPHGTLAVKNLFVPHQQTESTRGKPSAYLSGMMWKCPRKRRAVWLTKLPCLCLWDCAAQAFSGRRGVKDQRTRKHVELPLRSEESATTQR